MLLTHAVQSFWFLIHGTVLTSLLIEETEIYDDLTTNDRGHIVAILYFALMVVCGYSAFKVSHPVILVAGRTLFLRTALMSPGWIAPPSEVAYPALASTLSLT